MKRREISTLLIEYDKPKITAASHIQMFLWIIQHRTRVKVKYTQSNYFFEYIWKLTSEEKTRLHERRMFSDRIRNSPLIKMYKYCWYTY